MPTTEPTGGGEDHWVPRVVRLAPGADRLPLVLSACRRGHALIILPSAGEAEELGVRLRRMGVPVAVVPDEWAQARGGATVVGARSAAWAPVVDLAAVLVLDEHDEAHKQEQTPGWHARDVAVERARRAGVPCVLVSPCPSLEALEAGPLSTSPRSVERQGWPVVDVVDRREITELFDMKELLEGAAARLLAQRGRVPEIDKLEENLRQADEAVARIDLELLAFAPRKTA